MELSRTRGCEKRAEHRTGSCQPVWANWPLAWLIAIVIMPAVAMCADVISSNVVGYTTVTAPKGAFSIIANQLDNGKGNKIVDLIPIALQGTTLYKYAKGEFVMNSNDGDSWGDPEMTLKPGEAAFVFSPKSKQTFTFAGDLRGVNGDSAFAPVLPARQFSLVSSVVPVETKIGDLGLPATIGDTVYTFVGGFKVNTYDGDVFDDPTERINAGQGFFVYNASELDKVWDRQFIFIVPHLQGVVSNVFR